MKNYFLLFCLIFIFSSLSFRSSAQCPPSSDQGIHVVQKGETLYKISRKYNQSVKDICNWNGIKTTDVIRVCQELKVTASGASSSRDLVPKSASFESRMPQRAKSASVNQRQEGLKHTVRNGETVASLARLYGYTEERFREFNGLSSSEEIFVGQQLTSSECECALRGAGSVTSSQSGQAQKAPTNYGNVDTSPKSGSENTADNNSSSTSTGESASAYPFMSQTEMDMVNEINLVRSNPAGYVKYIEEYITELRKRERYGTAVQSANELIRELKETASLSTLKPTECLYNAAKNHGQDRLRAGSSGHQGTDGSFPWDRVLKSCPQMSDGNENLVGGPANVRDAVILLLVDDGISSRGHRRTLLNPKWEYVACYKIGQLGYMPNSWVQKFGS